MGRNCTICGEPTHNDLVVVESGIRRKRDGGIVFFVGDQEIECASLQVAESMLEDLSAMVKKSGGSTHPPHQQ